VSALGDLLATPARRWPDRTAIGDGTTSYTFTQLEDIARTAAARLDVRPGERVVVLADRRAVMPALALAIWKCGAVYVPLDAAEPAERLRRLLTRLDPAVVIAPDDREPLTAGRWLRLPDLLPGPDGAPAHTTVAHGPGDAAYIVFTAGPTGIPQGVENSAGALLAAFGALGEVLRLRPESRVLSLSPPQVDVSLLDTLLPLSVGARVTRFGGPAAGAIIRAVLAKERITHLVAVSMFLELITAARMPALPALEMVLTGAQVCDPAVAGTWLAQLPDVRLVQAFGPPEATIFCLVHEITGTPFPLGRPVRGMRAGIEDGMLKVGGDQLMIRYFDQPAETARVLSGGWFRTGDLVEDRLVFRGHQDPEVVWLAGRRSHLNEVRRAALECAGVVRAVPAVVTRNSRAVVALAVVAADRDVLDDVEEHLRAVLPEYLRPKLTTWSPDVSPETGDRDLIQRLLEVN
jgi:D-alanine--poly(phosphoribitol) ligase subunit 1